MSAGKQNTQWLLKRQAEGTFLLKEYNISTLHYNTSFSQNRKSVLYGGQKKLGGDIYAETLNCFACFIRQWCIFQKITQNSGYTNSPKQHLHKSSTKKPSKSYIFKYIYDFCSKLLCNPTWVILQVFIINPVPRAIVTMFPFNYVNMSKHPPKD